MKKILIVLIVFIVAILLAACVPTEPRGMLPYCQDQYELLLLQDPNFPKAFIGYCVSSMQTGKYTAYQPLCNYEPLWGMIEESIPGVTITSKSECLQYFAGLE